MNKENTNDIPPEEKLSPKEVILRVIGAYKMGITEKKTTLEILKDLYEYFERTEVTHNARLIETVEKMKKEVCGCDEDPNPQAPGYHTKECDMKPYGYNQAIDDIIKVFKESNLQE